MRSLPLLHSPPPRPPPQFASTSHHKTLKPSHSPPPLFAMKDRPPSSYGAVYVPPHHRLRSVITSPSYTSAALIDSKLREAQSDALNPRASPLPHSHTQQEELHKGSSQQDETLSEESSDRELESHLHGGVSPSNNTDDWKQKFMVLLRDKEKQELISREKKDRHDFEQLSALANRMGLYSHLYSKAVVFSKIPLPNYRFDLDDKRPQREVTLPLGLLRRVDSYFGEFISQKAKTKECFSGMSLSRTSSSCSIATDEGLFEQPEPLAASKTVMEKILRRRSLQLHDQQ